MELPYWMARALCSRKRHIISVEMPRQYREGYREILTADANVVDLHKLGPYYYSYGSQLLKFELVWWGLPPPQKKKPNKLYLTMILYKTVMSYSDTV